MLVDMSKALVIGWDNNNIDFPSVSVVCPFCGAIHMHKKISGLHKPMCVYKTEFYDESGYFIMVAPAAMPIDGKILSREVYRLTEKVYSEVFHKKCIKEEREVYKQLLTMYLYNVSSFNKAFIGDVPPIPKEEETVNDSSERKSTRKETRSSAR